MNTPPSPVNTARPLAPSNSVVKALTYGGPASILLGYLTATVSAKYAIPAEVVGAAISLLTTGVMTSVQYFSKGGRQSEAN